MNTVQITIPSTLSDTIKSLKTKLGLCSDSEVVEIAIKRYAQEQVPATTYSQSSTVSELIVIRDKIATKHPGLQANKELSETRKAANFQQLSGVWSDEETKKFNKTIKELDVIYPQDWK